MKTATLNTGNLGATKIIVEVLILVFAFFFIYTGTYKLLNIDALRYNLARTGVYPDNWLIILPYLIVGMEFTVVAFLLFKKRIGIPLFTMTMLTFTIYIIYLYYTGRYEVCGCGGVLNGLKFQYHLLINIAFFITSLLVQFKQKSFTHESLTH